MKFAHLKGHNSFSWIAVLRRGKVDAYIQLHNVFVELYLHKRCNCVYLLKFLKLFKTLIARVCLFGLILSLLICAGMNTMECLVLIF